MKFSQEILNDYIEMKVRDKMPKEEKPEPPKGGSNFWFVYFIAALIGLYFGLSTIAVKNSIKRITIIRAVDCKDPKDCQDFVLSANINGRNTKEIKWDITIGNDTLIEHRQNKEQIVIAISDTLPETISTLQNTLGKMYGKYNADIYINLESPRITNLIELSLYGQKSWF